MGVKISELPYAYSANNDDALIVNHESETCRISVQDLLESYLSSAGYVTESDLDNLIGNYLSSNLGNYLNGYVTESDLSNAGFITSSELSESLWDYVTSSALSDALSNYVESMSLSDYLANALSDYVSNPSLSSYLSEALSNYLDSSGLSEYLASNGYVQSNNFSSALEAYLTTYGGQTIYNAISQYINA